MYKRQVKVKYKEDGPSFEEVFKHLLQQQSMIDVYKRQSTYCDHILRNEEFL